MFFGPLNLLSMIMGDSLALVMLGVIGFFGAGVQLYSSHQIRKHGMAVV